MFIRVFDYRAQRWHSDCGRRLRDANPPLHTNDTISHQPIRNKG